MADNQVGNAVGVHVNSDKLDAQKLISDSGLESKHPGESCDSNIVATTQNLNISEIDVSITNNVEKLSDTTKKMLQADFDEEFDVSDSDDSDEDYDNNYEVAEDKKRPNAGGSADDQIEDTENLPLGDFIAPDEENARAISALTDSFFSDESISKESYLVKHIRRNKQGYVSLKVINSLRKMKRLTRDYRAISYSVKLYSTLLEVNEAETKVRRKDALTNPVPSSPASKPEAEVSSEYRTVVVMNLPTDKPPTITSVAELFSKCGPINQIRIIQMSSPISGNYGKLLAKHVSVGDGSCALIEFETISDAKKACKRMTDLKDWRHGLRVTLLAQRPKKEDKASNRSGQEGNGSDVDNQRPPRKGRKTKNTRVSELSRSEGMSSGSMYSSSGSDTEGRVRSSGGGWRSSSRNESTMGSDKHKQGTNTIVANLRSQVHHDSDNDDWRARSGSFDSRVTDGGSARMQSPWALRRLKAQQVVNGGSVGNLSSSLKSSGGERGSLPCLADASRVLRQPRGPDGTTGFRKSVTVPVVS